MYSQIILKKSHIFFTYNYLVKMQPGLLKLHIFHLLLYGAAKLAETTHFPLVFINFSLTFYHQWYFHLEFYSLKQPSLPTNFFYADKLIIAPYFESILFVLLVNQLINQIIFNAVKFVLTPVFLFLILTSSSLKTLNILYEFFQG